MDRFTKHFKTHMFKERLKEDERLNKIEVKTLAEAGEDDVLTDTSEDEDDMI